MQSMQLMTTNSIYYQRRSVKNELQRYGTYLLALHAMWPGQKMTSSQWSCRSGFGWASQQDIWEQCH